MVTLLQNGQFSVSDVWAQVRLAAEAGNLGVARRLVLQAEAPETLIVRALEKPDTVLSRGVGAGRTAHEAFIVALGRSARNNPADAANALLLAGEQLTPAERSLGWAQIALQAAIKLAPDAMAYWRKAMGAPLSQDGYQWQVRSALRAGDWKFVKAAIEAMPPALRADSAWIYWHARALQNEGRTQDAQLQFQSISAISGFYGQLALEELGQKIVLPARPAPLTAEELAPMAQNPGFKRAMKFFDLNLRFEGYREWNWELRRMNERQHLAAAEFARQVNLLDRMVNTSDRTQVAVDYTSAFPRPMPTSCAPMRSHSGWMWRGCTA